MADHDSCEPPLRDRSGSFALLEMFYELTLGRRLRNVAKLQACRATKHEICQLHKVASLRVKGASQPDYATGLLAKCFLVGSIKEKLDSVEHLIF